MPAIAGSKTRMRRVASGEDVSYLSARTEGSQDARRARGEMACAECSRMKLRCDRKVPCSSCERRGCSSICPNGALLGKYRSRLVLANTEDLHNKIYQLCERIRQLEDALEILQASCSRERHHLLREDLLQIRQGIDEPVAASADIAPDSDLSGAFGTLTISDRGTSRFIGRTGGTESLMMASPDIPAEAGDNEVQRSADARESPLLSCYLPCNSAQRAYALNILARLPTRERASSLCETYLEHATWLGRAIQRSQLIDELLVPIYTWRQAADASRPSEESAINHAVNIHELALFLMVLSVGALNDLTLPPYNEEAEQYYNMVRSITSLEVMIESPSLATIQLLCLISLYHAYSRREGLGEKSWAAMRLASVIGINMGLHRDPATWKLEDKFVQRRREVFWQIFTLENMQCLASGRPTVISLRFVDSEFPKDDGQQLDIESDFWRWRFRFAKEICNALNDLACTVHPIKYCDILAMDRKIRAFDTPPELRIRSEGASLENDGTLLTLHRCMTLILRDVTLLHIHCSFFCKALLDFPADPLKSQYAPSIQSAYHSALSLLKTFRELFSLCPDLMSRTWLWKHIFSCLVVIGSAAMKGSQCKPALSVLGELTQGIELFKNATLATEKARKALYILLNLRDAAYRNYNKYRSVHVSPVTEGLLSPEEQESAMEDEISIFGGLTRLIATKNYLKIPDPARVSLQSALPPAVSVHSGTGQSGIDVPVQPSSPAPSWKYAQWHGGATSYTDAHATAPSIPSVDSDPTFPASAEQGRPSEPPHMSISYDPTTMNDASAKSFYQPIHPPANATPQTWDTAPMQFVHVNGVFDSSFGSSGDQPMGEGWMSLMHTFGLSNPHMPANDN